MWLSQNLNELAPFPSTPIVRVRPVLIALAAALGIYPSSLAVESILSRVAVETVTSLCCRLRTRDTVEIETPEAYAICLSVAMVPMRTLILETAAVRRFSRCTVSNPVRYVSYFLRPVLSSQGPTFCFRSGFLGCNATNSSAKTARRRAPIRYETRRDSLLNGEAARREQHHHI